MPTRKELRDQAAAEADAPIGGGLIKRLNPMEPVMRNMGQRKRGLEETGFSAAESRAIHKAAGNDNPPRRKKVGY